MLLVDWGRGGHCSALAQCLTCKRPWVQPMASSAWAVEDPLMETLGKLESACTILSTAHTAVLHCQGGGALKAPWNSVCFVYMGISGSIPDISWLEWDRPCPRALPVGANKAKLNRPNFQLGTGQVLKTGWG